jgi:tRNA/rRNA methyltransferase
MTPSGIGVVLVKSKFSKNIGSTARAMANLGADKLFLIDRACELDLEARQGAAGAQRALENRIEYKSLKEMQNAEARGTYISLTRRSGQFRETLDLSEALKRINESSADTGPLYLVFGPEDHGLSGDDIALTHISASLPTFGDFASYNLAQAVLLTLFVARTSFPNWNLSAEIKKATDEPPIFPEEVFERWLTKIGYDLKMNRNASSKLMAMMMRAIPTSEEVKLLRSALEQTIRKLPNENQADKK